MKSGGAQRQLSCENGAAQGGGNSPKKSGGRDEEIAAQRMRA
jgi:hypothetical protein